MHKRKKPILPEQEFPEKKCVLIGIVIGVSLGLLLGVTCGSLLCGSLPLGICIGGAAGFCLGLAVGTAFQKKQGLLRSAGSLQLRTHLSERNYQRFQMGSF